MDKSSPDMLSSSNTGEHTKELLYMKFLQGTPIVGAIGGFYDVLYMKNITDYANIKYKRRFLSMR